MEAITVTFEDGSEKALCHDETGGLFDAGIVVGMAHDVSDLTQGHGELYTWGPFRVASRTPCRSQCDRCPAG